MSVKTLSNFSKLKLFNKNGKREEMPSLDYNRSKFNMDNASSLNSDSDDNSSIFSRCLEQAENLPQFSIELGGGRKWWF